MNPLDGYYPLSWRFGRQFGSCGKRNLIAIIGCQNRRMVSFSTKFTFLGVGGYKHSWTSRVQRCRVLTRGQWSGYSIKVEVEPRVPRSTTPKWNYHYLPNRIISPLKVKLQDIPLKFVAYTDSDVAFPWTRSRKAPREMDWNSSYLNRGVCFTGMLPLKFMSHKLRYNGHPFLMGELRKPMFL